ncbi:hypothetical protein NEMBOFW57_007535 [Staphylotrichum longicolle]|uniref:C-22 sterol desaturase n=1 Tax=Staphylotrichum longicolle TaxID=669026 RepID=A0AAD4HZ58_9PEZI|nr:hypothetical protein NEMBOFW57_007535 [Staphylotrichum longicolle]
MAANATTSPLATIKFGAANVAPQLEYVIDYVSNASTWSILATLLAIAVVYDQFRYIWNKGSIEGPAWKMPFIGPFLQSVNPKFEEYYAKWLSGPLSCVSVFHKFVVIASTRDMARKVFNSPAYVKPCVVDVAHKLLGDDNWVFLDGKAHVEFRKGLNGLFTRRALEIYLPGQEEVYNRYFKDFVEITKQAGGKPVPFMTHFREVITAVSCRTFVGHYISDEAVKKIADDYYLITAALELVNFPIILPWTKTWYGKKAADMVLAEFAKCAAKSKAQMAAGGEPNCIMDAWILQMIQSKKWRDAQEEGITVEGLEKPTHFSEIMAQRPDVLDRVREENLLVRNGDVHAAVTWSFRVHEALAVVRELLRYRPPTYTAPKVMVIPTTYMALRDPEVYARRDESYLTPYFTGDAGSRAPRTTSFPTTASRALMLQGIFVLTQKQDDCPLTFQDLKW